MAGTHGVSTFLINSKFASGNLVFYEKGVGRTATGDVFTVGTAAVKVGGTAQDVDFQVYGTGSLSAIIDIGAATLTLVGLTSSTDKPLTISDTTESTSTTTGALIVSGGIGFAKDMYVGDDVFLTSGAVLNFNAGDVTLTHSANTLTLAGGQFYMAGGVSIVGVKLGTLSSTTPGSGLTIDATTTRVLEVHADDNNAARAVGTQGRAIFGRTMIYADNACEDWGVHGLSKVSGVAKTGNVSAGVVGAFESTGTCSLATGSGNTFVAGVMGRIGGGGTFTINSGTYVVGVLAFNNTATAFTNTGTCGFMATSSDIAGTVDWDYGMYLENVDVGIQFAHTLTPDANRTNRAIGIGSRGTEQDVTMAAALTQHLDPIQLNLNIIGSNPTGSSTLNSSYMLLTHDTTDMSNMRLKNSDWNIVVGKDVLDVYCYQGEVDFNAAGIAVGGEASVMGLTLDAGANAVTGNLWGEIIVTQGAGLPSTSAGLFLSHRTGTVGHSLYIEANSGATITDAIYVNDAGTITNFLNFSTVANCLSTASDSTNVTHKIQIQVAGGTRYLHVFSD